MEDKEMFKDIPNYEGIYQISNFGRVKSLSRVKLNRGIYPQKIKEKILKPVINSRGYYAVTLCKNNSFKQHQIHMLVAICFLDHKPDRTTKIVVDHIDGIKIHNFLENLQLITHSENIAKCHIRKLPTGVTFDKRKNKYQARIRINSKQKHLGLFNSVDEASKAYQTAFKQVFNK